MKKENKKIKKNFLIIIIITIIFTIGISTAYLAADINLKKQLLETEIEKTAYVNFFNEKNLQISAGELNFSEGYGNLHDETKMTITLKGPEDYEEDYNLFINILVNEYVYTSSELYPELMLKVQDKDGEEITEIEGLTYVENQNGVSGFDITNSSGKYDILKNKKIKSKEDYIEITEEYKISVYFINLDHNQVENENKNFMASITAQRSDVYESYECTGANPFQSNTLLHEIVQNSGGIVCDEINFSKISETNGLFHTTDNYGDTFYYRGNIENNWFKFAGFYWRIIRINGDDSIRLIYSGKTDETEITRSQYNEEKNGPEMVGYTFIKESSESDSVIKTEVDAWYYENIYKKNFENFIKDTIYCTDRTSYEDPSGKKIIDTYIYKEQYFASYIFLRTNKSPNLYCNNTNDSYTVNDSIHGNTLLKYPVGLITAQEVALAGGVFDKSNQNYYLYTSSWYYTMSPSYYTGELSRIMTVSITGALANDFITGYGGIRPVISINSKNNFTGNGTKENPYEIY